MKKARLDVLVVERGLIESRQVAQTAIMDGAVLVNGEKLTKPGMNVAIDAKIELIAAFCVPKYVSRGGLKLEKALAEFHLDVTDRVCLDIGASTGGFTDCLLQHGASRVYAVDVGYGQIDWKLRTDSRVVLFERVNARNMEPVELYKHDDPHATLAVADVSFISLSKILPAAARLIQPNRSELICLIKPQFEVGREHIAKGGVVKSAQGHLLAINIAIAAAQEVHLVVQHLTFSPITGPRGQHRVSRPSLEFRRAK